MAGGRRILACAGCKSNDCWPGGRAHRLEKVGSVSLTAPFENISNNEGGIASARWFMLPREFSARDQPFCGTGLDHASDDELGALGLRRDVRSSPPGREQKAGQR